MTAERTFDIGKTWAYKNRALRVILAVSALVLLLAGVVPPLGHFLERQKFVGLGFGLALLLLVLDAVLSRSPEATRRVSEWPAVLSHTSDLGQLLPKLGSATAITLELASYSSETFYSVLSGFLDEVAGGKYRVHRLDIRLLVPNCSSPMGVPCLLDTRQESPTYKRYLVQRTDRFVREFENVFSRITRDQPQVSARFEVRFHAMSPLFKGIIINREVAYLGIYPIDRTPVEIDESEQIFLDYRGERTSLMCFELEGDNEVDRTGYEAFCGWYDSVWEHVTQTRDAV